MTNADRRPEPDPDAIRAAALKRFPHQDATDPAQRRGFIAGAEWAARTGPLVVTDEMKHAAFMEFCIRVGKYGAVGYIRGNDDAKKIDVLNDQLAWALHGALEAALSAAGQPEPFDASKTVHHPGIPGADPAERSENALECAQCDSPIGANKHRRDSEYFRHDFVAPASAPQVEEKCAYPDCGILWKHHQRGGWTHAFVPPGEPAASEPFGTAHCSCGKYKIRPGSKGVFDGRNHDRDKCEPSQPAPALERLREWRQVYAADAQAGWNISAGAMRGLLDILIAERSQ